MKTCPKTHKKRLTVLNSYGLISEPLSKILKTCLKGKKKRTAGGIVKKVAYKQKFSSSPSRC